METKRLSRMPSPEKRQDWPHFKTLSRYHKPFNRRQVASPLPLWLRLCDIELLLSEAEKLHRVGHRDGDGVLAALQVGLVGHGGPGSGTHAGALLEHKTRSAQ